MKKSLALSIAAIIVAGTIITSCDSPKEKVEAAQENVTESSKDLDDANKAYLADVETYRVATNERIAANNKTLEDLKVSVNKDKAKVKAEYNVKIAELEKKNADMKKKMDDYKAVEKDKWESFKQEFNHDMDGLGDAFKDLTVKNSK